MHRTTQRRAGAAIIATLVVAITLATASSASAAGPNAVRTDAAFTTTALPRNDDGFAGPVNIGFTVNFFGVVGDQLFVNNNGNVTFGGGLSTFTPFDLTSTATRIIAPFFADVDTRNLGSQEVRYGQGTVDGRAALGVNWVDVGFYNTQAHRLNSFQLVLIDRSDIGVGDFDIEFNYDRILWETGQASGGGFDGLGGASARAGYSNGVSGAGEASFELPGSAVPGGLLDSNATTGLVNHSLNSDQLGRYVFAVRNGVVIPPDNEAPVADAGEDAATDEGAAKALDGTESLDPDGDALTYAWEIVAQTGFDAGATCALTDEASANPSVTCDDDGVVTARLTVSDGQASATDDVTITVGNVPPKIDAFTLTGDSGSACLSGNQVNVSFTTSDPGANDAVHGSVSWGDGSPDDAWASAFAGSHTYSAGTYLLVASATDDDSEPVTESATVSHLYGTGSGFLAPINASGDRSVFRLGSTIPVKIQVLDCAGALVTTLVPDIDLTRLDTTPDGTVNEVVSSSAADSGDDMRWADDHYHYNLSTKRSQFCPSSSCSGGDLTSGTYRITVSDSAANDAFAPVSVLISLR